MEYNIIKLIQQEIIIFCQIIGIEKSKLLSSTREQPIIRYRMFLTKYLFDKFNSQLYIDRFSKGYSKLSRILGFSICKIRHACITIERDIATNRKIKSEYEHIINKMSEVNLYKIIDIDTDIFLIVSHYDNTLYATHSKGITKFYDITEQIENEIINLIKNK